ncbi:transmembrane protein C1orf162 homolog isoform X1 [Sorex fumeus]|uniref:transmembrane protein C1orf162 homolog isoform X1 n=1 Tax=Sorex fumeus TaxID=62283 RepID=UPI0024ADC62B|nr:transmembrane protein C1orf162 homolog isoform X1 [Sorex fumeus]
MGGMISKSTTTHEKHSTHSTVAPVSHHPVTTVRCSEACPIQNNLEHLILAFFAGVLLTLLLLALVFLFLKSYRKRHSHSQALEPQQDPYSEIPDKPSSSQEALTYAKMTFKVSEKKSPHLTANSSADSDSVIYSQVIKKNSSLPFQ